MSDDDIPNFAAIAATIIAHEGSIKNRTAYAEGCLFAAYAAGRKSAPPCEACYPDGDDDTDDEPPTGGFDLDACE